MKYFHPSHSLYTTKMFYIDRQLIRVLLLKVTLEIASESRQCDDWRKTCSIPGNCDSRCVSPYSFGRLYISAVKLHENRKPVYVMPILQMAAWWFSTLPENGIPLAYRYVLAFESSHSRRPTYASLSFRQCHSHQIMIDPASLGKPYLAVPIKNVTDDRTQTGGIMRIFIRD